MAGKNAKLREVVETVLDGWYSEGPIDWEDFFDRCERFGVDVGDQLEGPVPLRIRAIVRELRRAERVSEAATVGSVEAVKLRMLLKSANVDPGLVEVTPYAGRPERKPGDESVRLREIENGRERDVNPKTGEVYHEYLRGVLSIELCFVSDGEQPTSFDEVREWVEDYMRRNGVSGFPRLDVTIEEVAL